MGLKPDRPHLRGVSAPIDARTRPSLNVPAVGLLGAFDMSVLRKSAAHYRYQPAPVEFVCTEKLARRAIPQRPSYRLNALAAEFGLPLTHHDPVSDAAAAGLLWLTLLARSGQTPARLLRSCGYWGPGYCRNGHYQGFTRPQATQRRRRWR